MFLNNLLLLSSHNDSTSVLLIWIMILIIIILVLIAIVCHHDARAWDRYVKEHKGWADLCKGFLVEAKWYYSGYKPTFQEYIDNAWISISIPMILVHAYLFASNPTKEGLKCLEEYSSIFHHSGILFRLLDDLGTSPIELKRGDVPKSIQCYMYEAGVSEEKASQDIKLLIHEKWKHMNEERVADSPFSKTFIEIAMNVVRTGQFFYQYGDGYAIQDRETKEHVVSLFVDPIPLQSIKKERLSA